MYVGRQWLGYTDEKTMGLTPNFFLSQLKVHLDLKRMMYGNSNGNAGISSGGAGFIDQIEGW